jgi:hypothetical protein
MSDAKVMADAKVSYLVELRRVAKGDGFSASTRAAIQEAISELDVMRNALRRIAAIAPTPEQKYTKKNPGYACALDLGEIAREALDRG